MALPDPANGVQRRLLAVFISAAGHRGRREGMEIRRSLAAAEVDADARRIEHRGASSPASPHA